MDGAKILTLCEKGDQLLDEEVAKVYKGKKIAKGAGQPPHASLPALLTLPAQAFHIRQQSHLAHMSLHTLHWSQMLKKQLPQ